MHSGFATRMLACIAKAQRVTICPIQQMSLSETVAVNTQPPVHFLICFHFHYCIPQKSEEFVKPHITIAGPSWNKLR